MSAIQGKKVIVFGFDQRVKSIAATLEEAGAFVVKATTVDAYGPLIAAVEQHRDADIIVVYGGPLHNNVEFCIQQVRQRTKTPILLVMMQWYLQDIKKLVKAGATYVLARRYDIIEDEEVVAYVLDILAPVPGFRNQRVQPTLKLIQPQRAAKPVSPPPMSQLMPQNPASIRPQALAVPKVPLHDPAPEYILGGELVTLGGGVMAFRREDTVLPKAWQNGAEAPNESLLMIGNIVGKGRDIVFYGWKLHLSHKEVQMIELLHRNRDGVSTEALHMLGVKRNSTAVPTAISNLRKKLHKANHRWGKGVIVCVQGKYALNCDLLLQSRQN